MSSNVSSVAIEIQIPEHLHKDVQRYLEAHPNWDCDRLAKAAFSLFLLQYDSQRQHQESARQYLDAIFGGAA